MKKTNQGVKSPKVMIDGYKVTVKVTDQSMSLDSILKDLLEQKLEKI